MYVALPAPDPSAHLGGEQLRDGLHALAPSPVDLGRVTLLLARGPSGTRRVRDRVVLTRLGGMPDDRWSLDPKPDAQITAIEGRVGRLLANGQDLALLGDNLVLDLDLGTANLPLGARVRVGGAVLQVTPKTHSGCNQFALRFGRDALSWVNRPELRHLRLRGVYLRVIGDGTVSTGDPVRVLARS